MLHCYILCSKKGVHEMVEQERNKLSRIIGTAITKKRKEKGLTQAEAAKKLGIEQHSLSRMENGAMAPKFSRLQDIADLLDCSVSELFRDISESTQSKADAIADLLEDLTPELQNVVFKLVENSVAVFKKVQNK